MYLNLFALLPMCSYVFPYPHLPTITPSSPHCLVLTPPLGHLFSPVRLNKS